jgi:hypothetical protein
MTPSFGTAARILETTFRDAWPYSDVYWDGVSPQDAPQDRPYVIFSIHEGPSTQVGMPFVARCTGVMLVKINTPAGLGTRVGRDLADRVVTIFAGKKYEAVTCRMGSVRRIPPTEAATDEQFNVTIPFFYHAQ